MPTAKKDIIIPQSGTFRMVVTVVGGPASLTGLVGRMQVRQIKASSTTLVTVPESCFTVDNTNRQVVLEIPGDLTALYDWDNPAVYDMYLDDWRLVEGVAQLSKTVTR